MKNANQSAETSSKNKQRNDLIEFAKRLEELISSLKIEKREFAKAGGVTAQTLSGYLAAIREPGATALGGWVRAYKVNANWLLTGIGTMTLTETEPQQAQNPGTPQERLLEKFEELMVKHKASDQEIRQGLLARMGVASPDTHYTYTTAEPPADPGYNHIHEPGADFGENI